MNIHKNICSTRGLLILSASAALLVRAAAAADGKATPKAPDATPAAAMAGTGSLRGVSMAPGGFSLGAVNIAVHNIASSTDRQVVSDEEGVFHLDSLEPGTYQLTAWKNGFTSPPPTTIEVARGKTIPGTGQPETP